MQMHDIMLNGAMMKSQKAFKRVSFYSMGIHEDMLGMNRTYVTYQIEINQNDPLMAEYWVSSAIVPAINPSLPIYSKSFGTYETRKECIMYQGKSKNI